MSNSEMIPLRLRTTAVLSFIAGFVDSAGVICLFGLMPAHITGYLATAGQLYDPGLDSAHGGAQVSRLSLIAVFMLAVVATTLVHRWLRDRFGQGQTPSLMLCAFSLSMLALLGCAYASDANSPTDAATTILSAAAITCMAVQNTLLRISNHGLPPTTVMTGNAVQVLVDVTEMLTSAPSALQAQPGSERKERLVRFGTPLAGFCIGVGIGSVASLTCGLRCFMFPMAGAIVLAGISWWRESKAHVQAPLGIWHEGDGTAHAVVTQAVTARQPALGFRTCA